MPSVVWGQVLTIYESLQYLTLRLGYKRCTTIVAHALLSSDKQTKVGMDVCIDGVRRNELPLVRLLLAIGPEFANLCTRLFRAGTKRAISGAKVSSGGITAIQYVRRKRQVSADHTTLQTPLSAHR